MVEKRRRSISLLFLCMPVLLLQLSGVALGFQTQPSFYRTRSIGSTTTITSLHAKRPGPAATAVFEFQEMKVQLDAMKKAGVPSRDLEPAVRAELASYVNAVATKRPSPVPLEEVGTKLPGTKWRLAFSTEEAALGDLPRDASVYLSFLDDSNVDYILQFSEKTFGLNSITAHSHWTCSPGPTDPGLVTFVYDKVTADAFGFQGVGVGFFGLLKGRANYVESAYFDEDENIWIERSFGPTGVEYLNVYVRED